MILQDSALDFQFYEKEKTKLTKDDNGSSGRVTDNQGNKGKYGKESTATRWIQEDQQWK